MDSQHIPSHLRQFLLERDMATCFNLFTELNLARYGIASIEFEGMPPSYAEELSTLLGCDIKYQSKNIIAVDRAIVDQALPTYNANLVRLLETQCQQQLLNRQTSGFTEQVRQQLLGPLGLVASLEEVADKLELSTRSLRRKLEQAGTSFRSLVEDERRELALQLLTNTEITIEEISIHVGYADSASFTRAFRRWMNCSPGEYRKSPSAS